MPSLNTLQPEQVSHGSDIAIYAQLSPGQYVLFGEAYEIDWDEDQSIVAVPVMGSRRTGYRQGRYKITGTMKVYWLNNAVRAVMQGAAPALSGAVSVIYHSQRPFNRYNINVQSAVAGSPSGTIINAVFDKDAFKLTESALADETISFTAEDWIGL